MPGDAAAGRVQAQALREAGLHLEVGASAWGKNASISLISWWLGLVAWVGGLGWWLGLVV